MRSLAVILALAATPATALNIGSAIKKAVGVGQSVGHKTLVSDYMAKNVVALKATSSLNEAAEQLVKKKIRGAPVVDETGKLVGVLSQFDFLYKAAGRKSPGQSYGARSERYAPNQARRDKIGAQTVGDAMSKNPLTVTPDTIMQDAAALLLEKKIGRLIVVDDEQQLVGLLSCTDVMELVLSGDLEIV